MVHSSTGQIRSCPYLLLDPLHLLHYLIKMVRTNKQHVFGLLALVICLFLNFSDVYGMDIFVSDGERAFLTCPSDRGMNWYRAEMRDNQEHSLQQITGSPFMMNGVSVARDRRLIVTANSENYHYTFYCSDGKRFFGPMYKLVRLG